MTDAPSPPLLVLLPGLDGTGKLISNFVQALGADIDARIIGYPTHQPLGYEELERTVRAALPSGRPFILLGESFAGPIAIRIAASPPVGLMGVILCGTFAKNPYPLLGWASPLAFLVPIKSLPRWLRAPLMWGSKNASRAPAHAERAIAGVAATVVRRRIAALLTVDTSESLRKITVPALILYARNDRVVPYAATRWLSAHISGAEVEPIEGPHLLLQARPRECAAAVMPFIRKIWRP
ncbi:MAG: alpha/beta fold hydrolase [Steroidobacteraceae bacterium]